MSSRFEHKDPLGNISDRELNILTEVHREPGINQRELARRVGIALGMTNLLLHNLAKKGYLRINRAGWRHFLYNVTPDGISRKVQLTLAYVQRFLYDYQKVRQTLREQLETQFLNAESRVAIYGTGELAELLFLGLKEFGIEEVDVFAQSELAGGKFLGMPVRALSLFRSAEYDRIVVAYLEGADQQIRPLLELGISPEKLIILFNDSETPMVA